MSPSYLAGLFLFIVIVVTIYRRWLEHERARVDEIRRRERLRILLRREDPRK